MSSRKMLHSPRLRLIALALCFVYYAAAMAQPDAGKVELKAVKFDELADSVRAQRGKVLVFDVWAQWCDACKEKLPHLIEMQQRYKNDVVLMTVSVTGDKNVSKNVETDLAFLRSIGATGPNFLLNEKEAFWQDLWNLGGLPAVFVFDRQGRWVRFVIDPSQPKSNFTAADIEKVVKEFVSEKR